MYGLGSVGTKGDGVVGACKPKLELRGICFFDSNNDNILQHQLCVGGLAGWQTGRRERYRYTAPVQGMDNDYLQRERLGAGGSRPHAHNPFMWRRANLQ